MDEVVAEVAEEDDGPQLKLFSPAVDAVQSLVEVAEELNQKRPETLNRTIIHKCCLEQNFTILQLHLGRFQNTTEAAELSESGLKTGEASFVVEHISKLVNELDMYGNNALQLACIYPIY